MSELYTRIEKLCEENNTNVTELCRELKMPRSPLSELKAGRSKTLSSDKLVSIAEYFHVSVDWLVGNSEYRNIMDNQELSKVYFSLAKEAQDEGIDPDDIRLAFELIKANKKKGSGD